MKILFAIDTLQTGGAEKSTLEIVKRLPDWIQPTIVTFYKTTQSLGLDSGIQLKQFNLSGKYEFRKAIALFDAYCKAEKPDLVVATLFRSEYISRIVCKKHRIINIGTFVNDTYSRYELANLSWMMKIKIGWFWLLNWYTARYCSCFLSNSQSIKETNARALMIKPDKVHVIPRGRELAKFAYSDNRYRKKTIRFVNVGRLLPRKGQAEMIKAFSLLLTEYPDSELLIAGEGSYRHELERLIHTLKLQNQVKLLGTVKDVPDLLNTADVFVFPSWYEGFSGALVEAMLCGIPILASDISMNKEAVTHMETAYLFKVQNIASIHEAMKFSMENKTSMLAFAAAARELAASRYDIEKVAQQHASFYKAVYENHSAYSATPA